MSVQSISVQGIRFFNSAPSCISHFEEADWTEKSLSLIQSFGTLFSYALNYTLSSLLHPNDPKIDHLVDLTNTSTRFLSKKRLIVLLHGLNSDYYKFQKTVDEIENKDLSTTDIFIPRILQKGNAKLDEMVRPILTEIAKWATTSEEKELVLVGTSNGARIARAIDAEIGKWGPIASIKKVKVVSIVGVCKGTSFVDLINTVGLSWLTSKNISQEMPIGSMRNRQLDDDWMKGLSLGPPREYTFFASPHELFAPDYYSTLITTQRRRPLPSGRG